MSLNAEVRLIYFMLLKIPCTYCYLRFDERKSEKKSAFLKNALFKTNY